MSVIYHEKLRPAWWVYLVAVALGGTFGLVFTPHGTLLGTGVGILAIAALLVALTSTTPVVGVTGGELRAGRAHVPLDLTGTVEALDPAQMRQAHGPGLDARAFLCIRGWIATGVRVHLTDPRDPAPYWLVSSRRPAHLAEAITRARLDHAPQTPHRPPEAT